MKFLTLAFCSFLLLACISKPPYLEYALAQTAIQSARKTNARKNALSYWMKALNYYTKGEKEFSYRDYVSAGQLFNEAIEWAEKAENLSRFKILKGEGM